MSSFVKSIRKSSSSLPSSPLNINKISLRNSEEITNSNIEKSIQDWTIPKVDIKEICNQCSFK